MEKRRGKKRGFTVSQRPMGNCKSFCHMNLNNSEAYLWFALVTSLFYDSIKMHNYMINRVTLTRGHPRCTSPSMNDSGNSVEFHFLMSEQSGSQSQAASQLPLIPRFPLEDPGLKEKMPLIIQSHDEHHVTWSQKTRSNFWQSRVGLIVFLSVARCTLTIWT